MKTIFPAFLALSLLATAAPLLAAPPSVNGCQIFPSNHYWNTPIDQLPVDAVNSTNWINTIGANTRLHADWGNKLDAGPPDHVNELVQYGIPFSAGVSPAVATVNFDVPDESDPGPYRIPSNAQVEGGAGSGGDMHVLSLDTAGCKLYELYFATQTSATSWNASSGAVFTLNSNALRPDGYTSADASGLALFPGLVRWEEVAAGEINHAIRFTAVNIWASLGGNLHKYIWPATHWSGIKNNSLFPPMGARVRLKASVDISKYQPATQVVLRAMKKYGMVLVDGGSNWYFSGTSNTSWPDLVIDELSGRSVPAGATLITGSNFEVVDTALLRISATSAQAVQVPSAPTGLTATAGNGQATLTFTAPVDDGGSPIVTSVLYPAYKVTCTPGAGTTVAATGTSSPITVTGLTNGTPYGCTVAAANVTGVGSASASANVTPGQGVLSASPPNIDFGSNALVTPSASQIILVTNAGSGNSSAIGELLSGPNPASFARTSTCSGTSLAPGATCSISVTFNPATTGVHAASLTLSGATTSNISISLSGNGITTAGAPIIGTPVAGSGQVAVFFTAPVSNGGSPITNYTATCIGGGSFMASRTTSPITVTGLANGTSYSCTVTATNAAGISSPSASANAMPDVAAPLALVNILSRKTHTGVGDYDIDIVQAPLATDVVTVEPRALGIGHVIVFQFNNSISAAGTVSAIDAVTMTPVAGVSSTAAGSNVTVTVATLADNKRIKITLDGVNGAVTPVSTHIGFLVGDVNNTRSVNSSDISAVKARSGQATTAANFKFDLNASGAVNASDISAVKARSGISLP